MDIMKIFEETAYVRMGGSAEELRCAEYLKEQVAALGMEATIEAFQVQMANIEEATLVVDGKQIPCKGYRNAGSHEVEAPLYYLTSTDAYALSKCKGKIVLLDGYLGYWMYRDILENGAVGFITYDGHANYADCDIDQRELRAQVSEGVEKIPGVNINAKAAIELVKNNAATAKIVLKQEEFTADSHNVILEMPGTRPETIVFTAHYDSTSLSQGAYDNMSGSVGLLGIAEYFTKHPHAYGLRFVWCGSEERGLLGAKAYCRDHEETLQDVVLNINLDMIGCVMGKMIACCTTEDKLVNYIEYFGLELGKSIRAYQDVYSSDSTPFADKGLPAVSFARACPPNTGTIHNSYDTMALMKAEQMEDDIAVICAFADRMANAVRLPVERKMPDNMKDKLDIYLCRKRDKK